MTYEQMRDALVANLQNNWPYPAMKVEYDNIGNLDPSLETAPFILMQLHWDDAVQANIGDNPFHRTYGTVVLTVFVKEGEGTRAGLALLTELSSLFKFKNLGGVHTQAPRPGTGPRLPGWYPQAIRVSFYADSNA